MLWIKLSTQIYALNWGNYVILCQFMSKST